MATQQSCVTLTGIVEPMVESSHSAKPGQATISIRAANDLQREIRIENTLKNSNGDEVSLNPGAKVLVTIKAEQTATMAKG